MGMGLPACLCLLQHSMSAFYYGLSAEAACSHPEVED